MSEEVTNQKEDSPPVKPKRNWLWTILKITAFLFAILAICLTVLANIGGQGDTYKTTVEQYIGDIFQGDAQIGTFHQMRFYPYITLDIEDTKVFKPSNPDIPVATAGRVQVAVSFWDVIYGRGNFKVLNIREFETLPGLIGDRPLSIKTLKIADEKPDEPPFLTLSGRYGDKDVSAYARMERFESIFGGTKYRFGGERDFDINIADLNIKGRLSDYSTRVLRLDNLDISRKRPEKEEPQKLLSGSLDFSSAATSEKVFIEGALDFAQGSTLRPDLAVDLETENRPVTGSLEIDLNLDELGPDGSVKRIQTAVKGILNRVPKAEDKEPAPINFDGIDVDIVANVSSLYKMRDLSNVKEEGLTIIDIGSLRLPIKIQDNILDIHSFTGKLLMGDLKGNMSLNATQQPADLKADWSFKDFDYTILNGADPNADGHEVNTNFTANLHAQANNWGDLRKKLNGEMAFLMGESEFETRYLDIWGGGLVNALLPSVDPSSDSVMNCALADIKVKDGVAEFQTLFLDTDRITVRGEGDYNIADDNLNLTLTPESKSVAIGDISSAIDVSGSIGDVSITPNILSLGTKIGSLVLTSINPAFMAISLASLGLTENHPCMKYIEPKQDEEKTKGSSSAEEGKEAASENGKPAEKASP